MAGELLTQAQINDLKAEILKIEDVEIRVARLKALLELQKLIAEANTVARRKKAREATVKLLKLMKPVAVHVANLREETGVLDTSGAGAAVDEMSRLLNEAHVIGALPQAFVDGEETIDEDEVERPPAKAFDALPSGQPINAQPTPINAKTFDALSDEYLRFFVGARARPSRSSAVAQMVETALDNRVIYRELEVDTGVPWWFTAGLHQMESSYNFKTHLHNGDPLSARTENHPPGRPATGNPPFTWEVSARDALARRKLTSLSDWSLARALYRWEGYNGFGYRSKGVPTPYLWSFSTLYTKGKFVADGKFDASAVSQQCGAAMLLKALHEAGEVPELKVEALAESEVPAEIAPAAPTTTPPADTSPSGHPFEAFFAARLGDVQHFAWQEFLFKGHSQAKSGGLNTDPPEHLYESVVPLVRVLNRLRAELGAPIHLNSVYRSDAYNDFVGGVPGSQHRKFTAADFTVVGAGGPKDWARALSDMRDAKIFSGGIGIYESKNFVHVDVRGTNANWTG